MSGPPLHRRAGHWLGFRESVGRLAAAGSGQVSRAVSNRRCWDKESSSLCLCPGRSAPCTPCLAPAPCSQRSPVTRPGSRLRPGLTSPLCRLLRLSSWMLCARTGRAATHMNPAEHTHTELCDRGALFTPLSACEHCHQMHGTQTVPP